MASCSKDCEYLIPQIRLKLRPMFCNNNTEDPSCKDCHGRGIYKDSFGLTSKLTDASMQVSVYPLHGRQGFKNVDIYTVCYPVLEVVKFFFFRKFNLA